MQAGKKYGARLRYLLPYFSDFNPIEWAFSKLKTWLRTARAHTRDVREEVIRTAAEWISAHDAKNGFDHCGYHVHRIGNCSNSSVLRNSRVTSRIECLMPTNGFLSSHS